MRLPILCIHEMQVRTDLLMSGRASATAGELGILARLQAFRAIENLEQVTVRWLS
jgi:hypothetical protein